MQIIEITVKAGRKLQILKRATLCHKVYGLWNRLTQALVHCACPLSLSTELVRWACPPNGMRNKLRVHLRCPSKSFETQLNKHHFKWFTCPKSTHWIPFKISSLIKNESIAQPLWSAWLVCCRCTLGLQSEQFARRPWHRLNCIIMRFIIIRRCIQHSLADAPLRCSLYYTCL